MTALATLNAASAARADAGGLTHQIVQQLLELEHTVAELPPDIQSSTRIDDTFRAMHQVMQGLRQSLVSKSPASAEDGR